jgi:hypothetical protein
MSDSDILRGVPQIHAYVNSLMDKPLSERQVYRAIEFGEIPSSGKLLGQHLASKTAIRAALGIAESNDAAVLRKRVRVRI